MWCWAIFLCWCQWRTGLYMCCGYIVGKVLIMLHTAAWMFTKTILSLLLCSILKWTTITSSCMSFTQNPFSSMFQVLYQHEKWHFLCILIIKITCYNVYVMPSFARALIKLVMFDCLYYWFFWIDPYRCSWRSCILMGDCASCFLISLFFFLVSPRSFNAFCWRQVCQDEIFIHTDSAGSHSFLLLNIILFPLSLTIPSLSLLM